LLSDISIFALRYLRYSTISLASILTAQCTDCRCLGTQCRDIGWWAALRWPRDILAIGSTSDGRARSRQRWRL